MKAKAYLFLIFLIFSTILTAQVSLDGNWNTSVLLGSYDVTEYKITKADSSDPYGYGYKIWFYDNSKFQSIEVQECISEGYDVYHGTYKWINSTHIELVLDSIIRYFSQDGNTYADKKIGLFYVYQDSSFLKLIKSDGNVKQDLKNIVYSKKIKDFKDSIFIPNKGKIDFYRTKSETDYDIVKETLIRHNIPKANKFNILYSKHDYPYLYRFVLIKHKRKEHYIIISGKSSALITNSITF